MFLSGFLQREDCNFIAVDWQLLAMPPLYPKSVANVRPVGILTGNLVDFLISQGANRLRFHLLGFSLGAHIVGRAGSTATNRIPRITGSKHFWIGKCVYRRFCNLLICIFQRIGPGIPVFWKSRRGPNLRKIGRYFCWHYPYERRVFNRKAPWIPVLYWTRRFLAQRWIDSAGKTIFFLFYGSCTFLLLIQFWIFGRDAIPSI